MEARTGKFPSLEEKGPTAQVTGHPLGNLWSLMPFPLWLHQDALCPLPSSSSKASGPCPGQHGCFCSCYEQAISRETGGP